MSSQTLPPRYRYHLHLVAAKYGLPPERVAAFGQKMRLQVTARMEMVWRLCILEEIGFSKVAFTFGVDHSSVIHSSRRYCHERFGSPANAGLNRMILDTRRSLGSMACEGLLYENRMKPINDRLDAICPAEAA